MAEGGAARVELAPRHLVSAASYALASGRIAPRRLASQVIERLNAGSSAAAPARRTPLRLVA
jgi:hypothetical protein